MALYHQVYQLKRSPGEIPCSENTTEETLIEILETLKACLWHRQGSAQPEEQRGRSMGIRTTRTPAQAEFHARHRQPMTILVTIETDKKSPRRRP